MHMLSGSGELDMIGASRYLQGLFVNTRFLEWNHAANTHGSQKIAQELIHYLLVATSLKKPSLNNLHRYRH